jgi:hypothetical protein
VEFLISIFVTGINDAICLRAKNCAQIGFPVIPQGGNERVHSVL